MICDSDVWLRLDNSHFDNWEKVKEKFSRHIEHNEVAETSTRYIDTMPKTGHCVFVTDKLYKKFGYFIGANVAGKAFVIFENVHNVVSVEASQVISM